MAIISGYHTRMLQEPDLSTDVLAAQVQAEYGLEAVDLAFLPLGADYNTAIYRFRAGQSDYFLKLRSGAFDPLTVLIPHTLWRQGVPGLIPPLETAADEQCRKAVAFRQCAMRSPAASALPARSRSQRLLFTTAKLQT